MCGSGGQSGEQVVVHVVQGVAWTDVVEKPLVVVCAQVGRYAGLAVPMRLVGSSHFPKRLGPRVLLQRCSHPHARDLLRQHRSVLLRRLCPVVLLRALLGRVVGRGVEMWDRRVVQVVLSGARRLGEGPVQGPPVRAVPRT